MESLVVEVLASVALALPLHEAGHWFAARMLGARRIDVERSGWLGASVRASFDDERRGRRALFFAAGPLAGVFVGALALVVGAPWFAGIQLLFSLLMLVPAHGSDGARLLSLVVERR